MNRRMDMNKPDSASFCPTLCSQEARNQTAAGKAGLVIFVKISNKKNTMER